ncbi:MAG: S1 RNA-binding domain-containing protein [Oscillospiraceae bacterium]|nr:S1 RNA-binding domain-containing protein [Oscillospiraceae bacterium]
MSLEVGSVLTGKVTGVMKFGAFVALPQGKSGMVHISEISHEFVNDINDVIKVGDEVTVKVMSVEDEKISLSIKANLEKPAPKPKQKRQRKPYVPAPEVKSPGDFQWENSKSDNDSFEDMMNRFKKTSEDKFSDLKRGNESRGYSRRGGRNK